MEPDPTFVTFAAELLEQELSRRPAPSVEVRILARRLECTFLDWVDVMIEDAREAGR